MRISFFSLLLCLSIISNSQDKPNVIVILGDDMGFSDLGSYGSEVATPNLDMLAENGIRFRQFYNMAKCAPSRAALITGQNIGNDCSVSIAEALKPEGYFSIFCGKEHVEDWMPKSTYVENSFTKSLYHRGNEFFIPPSGKMHRPFVLNGKRTRPDKLHWKKLPVFYKPDVMTDYALAWMDQAKNEKKPIFLYMAYHVAHYPLQAREEDIAKYRDVYRVGWDVIRKQRFERQKELGVITDKHQLTDPLDNVNLTFPKTKDPRRVVIPKYRPWDSLTTEEQDEWSLEMAVYSAMIDRMDQNIGRLISWLKENGEFDNTIIMYLSDNGSSPYDSNHSFEHPPGGAESWRALSTVWANVANTPFKYYKSYGFEGGSNTHFIMHWPEKLMQGEIVDGPGHITDIFPTILDATDTPYPDKLHDAPTLPLHGSSLLPLARGEDRDPPKFIYSGFKKRMRSYREGDWKIVKVMGSSWHLYNMKDDPTETNNLAEANPEKVAELETAYLGVEKLYDKYKGKK